MTDTFADVDRLELHCAADPLPAAGAYRQAFCGLVTTSRSQLSRAAMADAPEVQPADVSATSLYMTVMETLGGDDLEGHSHEGSVA